MDSTSSLLAKYRSATCIPFSRGPGHERHWEMTIPLRDGSKAVVGAAAWAGGMAVVTYPLLSGELLPFVDISDVPRAAMGRPRRFTERDGARSLQIYGLPVLPVKTH